MTDLLIKDTCEGCGKADHVNYSPIWKTFLCGACRSKRNDAEFRDTKKKFSTATKGPGKWKSPV